MVTKILIVRNTLGCLSSGISFCRQREFVILLILYKIKTAKIIKMEIIENSLLKTVSDLKNDMQGDMLFTITKIPKKR